MAEHEADDDLLRLAAEALRGVLPMSSDGTGHIDCEYDEERNLNCGCIDVLPRAAAAVLEAVLPEVWARAISDVAYQFQMGGWTILTAPPPAGAIPSIALGQRVTDWLRARADEERRTAPLAAEQGAEAPGGHRDDERASDRRNGEGAC